MAENIIKLRKRAVAAGMDAETARAAERPALEKYLKKNSSAAPSKPSKKKKAKKSSVSKPKAAKKNSKPKAEKASKPKKNSKPSKKASKGNSDVGRASIGKIDWTETSDDWNPKNGSAVDRLFKALKKCKGNVEKAHAMLKGDVWEFVGKTKRDGTKRDKADGLAMLKYRLNRTKFEFATRTGQHSKGTNRVTYGEGDYAAATKKAARKAKSTAKKSTPAKKKAKKKKK